MDPHYALIRNGFPTKLTTEQQFVLEQHLAAWYEYTTPPPPWEQPLFTIYYGHCRPSRSKEVRCCSIGLHILIIHGQMHEPQRYFPDTVDTIQKIEQEHWKLPKTWLHTPDTHPNHFIP